MALLALGLDLAVGQPPDAVHPVAWKGRLIGLLYGEPSGVPGRDRTRGIVATALLAGLATFEAMILRGIARIPLIGWLVEAVELWLAFSASGLTRRARLTEAALEAGDLETARALTAQLVSRPTADLEAPALRTAVIESLAENLADSVTGPFLAWMKLGLPGVLLYRAINTADAMVGYRDERRWLGEAPARVDDVLGFVPARIAAATIVALAPVAGGDRGTAAATAFRFQGRTPSPNGGWPMAAMAGALDVRLDKPGQYDLNPAARTAGAFDVQRATTLVLAASIATAVVAGLLRGNRV